MITACPKCAAKYRVDPGQVGPDGARLRCARCQAVFRVRAAAAAPPLAEPTREIEAPAPPREAAAPPASEAPSPSDAEPPADRERLVLIADSEVEGGRETAAALRSWGLEPLLVHDGVDAMLTIQRTLPRVVVLDAALPKMFGFQICEVIKRNVSLRDIHVVLVGSIHDNERYRRPPSQLYGADVYLERPDMVDGLAGVLRRFGLPVGSDAPPAQAPAPQSAPAAQAPAPQSAPAEDEEVVKAERLARIIVSDIVLYNPEHFEAGLASGRVVEALDAALQEGRELFRQRVPESVRAQRDFLVEELMRVAREREAR